MLRKMMTALALAAIGLVATSGMATADPGYAADEFEFVAVNDDLVLPGDTVIFSGGGYTPGEDIVIDVVYGVPALRAQAVSIATRANERFTVKADDTPIPGRFATRPITLPEVGVYTLTATGLTSGISLSKTVTVSTSANSGTGAVDNGSTTDDGGLAYTGSSIAGPLAVGAGALAVGLLLLFFGTRMAIRRKSHSA